MECLREKFVAGTLLDGGRFQAISPLNHGSFGIVFMANDLASNTPVAIKCLTKKTGQGDAGQELAVDERSDELALHKAISPHDNIVNLLHSFETDAHFYLVLEFCGQGDLYEAIRNGHGPLQTEHVRQFMLELVDAVEYIHSKGIYHRDIKPENIFLMQDGAMKLGDFGLATVDKWSYEMTVGSDRYMAPEQFDSAGAGYSPAEADIWAIGICLLNILFSRNPFTTPTEADPLFLDYSRDKQSLFDVFPSMSQDTYEVIVQCMNLDPRRRSLVGAREALMRVVSFTTADELLDDFCGAETTTVVSANREPLRTPSLQSPQVDTGTFPWTRALHATSRVSRQLSAIRDDESYTEDLFSKSENTVDWFSGHPQTPSMSSTLDSHIVASMKTMDIARKNQPKVSPAAGSLPIAMTKPQTLSISSVLGHREAVSKSWSDMWDEDEQEIEQQKREAIHAINSRYWSFESVRNAGKKISQSAVETTQMDGDIDDDSVADCFFFQEPILAKSTQPVPRYSPPSKRNKIDKWAALGERRRGSTVKQEGKPRLVKEHNSVGLGYKSSDGEIVDEINSPRGCKERVKESPANKSRDLNWRRCRRTDVGNIEWVGGW